MLSRRFGENLFDDMFGDPFDLLPVFSYRDPLYGKPAKTLMKTDIREKDDSYELDIDLPGFNKDEIHAQISDGYLTVSASKGLDRDKKDDKGRYIRRERYCGECSRPKRLRNGRSSLRHAKSRRFGRRLLLFCLIIRWRSDWASAVPWFPVSGSRVSGCRPQI